MSNNELYNEWLAYHEANPQVYQLICRFTQEVINRGYRQYSIGSVWERLRWHATIETVNEDFKLPNNHRAYYARLWLKDHPEFPKFFRTACLRSEGGKRDRYGRAEGDDDNQPRLL